MCVVFAPAPAPVPSAEAARAFAAAPAERGAGPAGSETERAAHAAVRGRFRAAGLRLGEVRVRGPGGWSRDVIGIGAAPWKCLVIAGAHADTVPPAPGADDNASGVGALVALAPALAQEPTPRC